MPVPPNFGDVLIPVKAAAGQAPKLDGQKKRRTRMSRIPHELHGSFPEYADKIDELKGKDGRFAKLVADYDEVNEMVHKAETRLEPTDDFHEEELKKRRMALRDEIYRILSNDA